MPPGSAVKSFEAMFQNHHLAVLRFARRRLGEDDAAWDVVSETFLVVWRSWEKRPAEAAEALPWLYAIAGNVVRNRRRSQVRTTRLTARLAMTGSAATADPAGTVDAVADEAVRRDQARRVLERLSDDDREVLMLAVWEGLDAAGLATALSVSPAAAKVRLHRARRRLQALVEESRATQIPLSSPALGRSS
ncbi:putative RNA polymerase ECF-subfamily sigma factor [Frankia canadensis]|uniref:Putative RNA polymerase ECF-subfamily sigma factor n=1 Tax=Frankia canadensis TaxID=1836972 RepID=A0A2I2KVD3_9ACTN|nr:sigma-70 family RNA polymerase sigma factor [Frankia canadensis]SNQ49629.1 putative RNA polymerase ECF-subfamily sigma factor [Frankia canadensis]SOU56919.1 putative RNA polymerase ECF-subfamily sigma factor [Frankia canadensis]